MSISLVRKISLNLRTWLLLVALSLPQVLLADNSASGGGTPTRSVQLLNPLAADSIVQLIGLVFNIITILLIPVAIFFLVLTGFNFITAGGDKTKLGKAKMQFFYVVIGIALILGAQLIGAVLQNTLVGLRRG